MQVRSDLTGEVFVWVHQAKVSGPEEIPEMAVCLCLR